MAVQAFVDESRRKDTYFLAAALVELGDLTRLRTALRALLFPGQRELHFQRETPQRRKAILSRLVEWEVRVDLYRADCGRSEEQARQTCLVRLVDDLLDIDARRLVLDSRPGRDRHDVRTIRNASGKRPRDSGLLYEHFDSALEPLLWVADIAAWSYGAGGDWTRRVEPVIGSVIRLDWP
ncbi:DUF3800 domain-containing protein [Actinosynnema sp. NPDC059335]|uniref:DUF3800 domain-containing protein n=1 Tax=Actinosynnema sp. NPDC059335 TaxID=3346804 RepID=UPI00366C8D3F